MSNGSYLQLLINVVKPSKKRHNSLKQHCFLFYSFFNFNIFQIFCYLLYNFENLISNIYWHSVISLTKFFIIRLMRPFHYFLNDFPPTVFIILADPNSPEITKKIKFFILSSLWANDDDDDDDAHWRYLFLVLRFSYSCFRSLFIRHYYFDSFVMDF